MQRITSLIIYSAAFVILVTLSSSSFAEKPSWAGDKGGPEKQEQSGIESQAAKKSNGDSDKAAREGERVNINQYFDNRHRTIINQYYDSEFRAGRCPPGLAKKRNGCMPPGQAKKWAIGRPLPADVVYYDLPQAIVVEIGLPPAGYRYARIATDILLIAIGTGIVVDAIQDLGRM